jgi:hypothetical protein
MECSLPSNKLGEIGAMSLAPDLVSDPPLTLETPLRTPSSGSSLVESVMFVSSYLICITVYLHSS